MQFCCERAKWQCISVSAAMMYCQDIITQLNVITWQRFCLSTEAEWEFAARGGVKSQGHGSCGSNTLDDVAWYADNAVFWLIKKKRNIG